MNDNTLKRLHISENNIINDFIDNNFETIKVNHIHPKHKKEKILIKYNKKPTLKQLEEKFIIILLANIIKAKIIIIKWL